VAPSDSRSVNRYGHGLLVCKFPINVTVLLNKVSKRVLLKMLDRLRQASLDDALLFVASPTLGLLFC
jgi:hypothetical protein